MLNTINTQLFMLINATPNASKSMISFAVFCAEYLIYAPIIIMLVCWFKNPASRNLIAKIALTTLTALIIAAILRTFISSPRPFELSIGTNFLSHSSSNSFPSKHAVFIFAITFALFNDSKQQIMQKCAFIACLFVAMVICWSRIYLGVHWPLDITAGIVVSALSAYIVQRNWFNLTQRFTKIHTSLSTIMMKFKVLKHITKNSNS